jgi:hypothetical protein
MKGMTAIREKRGIQWNRSQIIVSAREKGNPAELYSGLKNNAVTKCPNA